MTAGQADPAGAARRGWPMRLRGELALALGLFIVLLAVNIILNTARFVPSAWGTTLGLAAPLIVASVASMPAILGGRGGIDVSVGPLMGFVNCIIVEVMLTRLGIASPFIVIPAALAIGAVIGLVNGLLAAVVRIQPIVATLGTYLVLSGLTLTILPAPSGTVPAWLRELAGPWSFLPLLMLALFWWLFTRTPAYDHLMATGSDDRAAYTAGVPVTAIRILSYVLTGLFAGLGGLLLTALIGSADPTIGPTFTLIAISAVALGGVSLAGGRGGFLAALIGAVDIFLLQSALTYFNVSTFALQIAYGLILVGAVCLNAISRGRGGA